VACEAARGERDFGRASERFESGRHQRSKGLRPCPRVQRLSGGLPATAVTEGTVPVTASPAADHGGRGAGHCFHSSSHSNPCDGERTASPGSAAAAVVAAAAIKYFTGFFQGKGKYFPEMLWNSLGLFGVRLCSCFFDLAV
jgi:hypothetical protein